MGNTSTPYFPSLFLATLIFNTLFLLFRLIPNNIPYMHVTSLRSADSVRKEPSALPKKGTL